MRVRTGASPSSTSVLKSAFDAAPPLEVGIPHLGLGWGFAVPCLRRRAWPTQTLTTMRLPFYWRPAHTCQASRRRDRKMTADAVPMPADVVGM
jgi:hypothetical protein